VIPTRRGADAYRNLEAQSRTPLELVVMMYDGALRFANEARDAHGQNNRVARGRAVSRVLAIIGELQNTLNVQDGGAVAEELDRLYSYLTGRLVDVSAKNDGAALDEICRLLTTLRDGWTSIASGTPPK
jgi:flagellar secretion chaperone FliS